MGENLVFLTGAFPPRETRELVRALKAKAFQLGTKRQYYLQIIPDAGHEHAVVTVCKRLFREVPANEAAWVLATLPRLQLQ